MLASTKAGLDRDCSNAGGLRFSYALVGSGLFRLCSVETQQCQKAGRSSITERRSCLGFLVKTKIY